MARKLAEMMSVIVVLEKSLKSVMENNRSEELRNEYGVLALEIQSMYTEDQAMRERAHANDGIVAEGDDETLDKRNTERMKGIVEKIGWPTVSKVGSEASRMSWLLVQHADHDVEFQNKCLALMRFESESEVLKIDVAYLEDRVRVNEGRPQLYGTQFYGQGDSYGPRPIEDPEHVDQRRKELGLDSLEDYKKRLIEKYLK
jgi:hypothetical protein